LSISNGSTRPKALPVIPKNLPAELEAIDQWVVWRYVSETDPETGEVDWDKPPLNARTLRLASSTDASTWSTFDQALEAYQRGGLDGIGLVLHRAKDATGPGLVGIDLDKCRNPETGEVEDWAQEIIRDLDSYTEVSPSGRGIRIFLYGTLPPSGRKKGRFECYETGRYVTVTGHRLEGTT
jgi:putative DNA primase/helicase